MGRISSGWALRNTRAPSRRASRRWPSGSGPGSWARGCSGAPPRRSSWSPGPARGSAGSEPTAMELFIFARFHARPGCEAAVAEALLAVIAPTAEEPGCLGVHALRSTRDPRLFYIHSRWRDEAAFETHASLPHTL